MQILYADILFLINLCMDFIALWCSGGILHLPRRRILVFLASMVGGAYAVCAVIAEGNPTISILIGAAVAFLLCYIAYGKECGRRLYFGLVALFYAVSWLLGGMISAFYTVLAHFLRDREEVYAFLSGGEGRLIIFFAVVLLALACIAFFSSVFSEKAVEKTARIKITAGDGAGEFRGFVDTGNRLREPLSGRACVIVDPRAARGVIPMDVLAFSAAGGVDPGALSRESARRIRLVPMESLGGRALLVGYIPSRIEILPKNPQEPCRIVDAVVVLDSHTGGFDGYDAILPPVIMI